MGGRGFRFSFEKWGRRDLSLLFGPATRLGVGAGFFNRCSVSEKDFADVVMEAASSAETFEPMAVYDQDGDCIEFLFSNESYYAQRFDSLVTVYYGRESGEIVGSLIKGVKTL